MRAHLKALGILVWILGPESTTTRVSLCQIWSQCEIRIRQSLEQNAATNYRGVTFGRDLILSDADTGV